MTIPFDPGTIPISQMTGMPKGKRTRRGGRGKKHQDPSTHVSAAQKALASGDHATAKKHAFALVRSLHAKMPPSTGDMGQGSPFPGGIQKPVSPVPSHAVSAPTPAQSGALDPAQVRASRLVHALHQGRRK